jgi:hypothetical protein
MRTKRRCIIELELLREAASSAESGYLVRTRFRRLIRSCEPHLESAIGSQESQSFETNALDLRSLRDRLRTAADQLCQPSEALDDRWTRGWAALQPYLEQLHSLLVLEF